MNRYLVDTDILSLFLQRHVQVVASVERHKADDVSTSIITMQEIWDGWVAALAKSKTPDRLGRVYQRFTDTLNDLKQWRIETFSTPAIVRFEALKKMKLNVASKDLKIASIALESGATVVTRNLRDFQRVPGLACEDWSQPR